MFRVLVFCQQRCRRLGAKKTVSQPSFRLSQHQDSNGLSIKDKHSVTHILRLREKYGGAREIDLAFCDRLGNRRSALLSGQISTNNNRAFPAHKTNLCLPNI